MGRHQKGQAAPNRNPAAAALDEAGTLQQRGERRAGRDALACFEQAAAKFQEAVALSAGQPDVRTDGLMGLGECLAQCAEAVVELAAALPDAELSRGVEEGARARAVQLYAKAVDAYNQVGQSPEAAVNCANALCSWAELLPPLTNAGSSSSSSGDPSQQLQPQAPLPAWRSQQLELFERARQLYEQAVAQEEDALTWGNMGDCLMQYAQALWDAGRAGDAETACTAALAAYEKSCSLTDNEDGDDLPGLLCNWGVGATTASEHTASFPARAALLSQAIARLTAAAGFSRGDPEPLVALGDALTGAGECSAAAAAAGVPLAGAAGSQHQQLGAAAGGGVASEGAPVASASAEEGMGSSSGAGFVGGVGGGMGEAVRLMRRALEEGYGAALHINRSHPQALVGAAEAHTTLARWAAQAGDAAAAASHAAAAVQHYQAALASPDKLGGFCDRCDVRYNYACVLAQMPGRDAEAAALVAALVAAGGTSWNEVQGDGDLAPALPAIQAILAQQQQQEQQQQQQQQQQMQGQQQ